ncbi:MAG: helix-turn-helix domain-containing protein, partial [Candidatus Odinarchaeota archaeon]
KIDHYCPFKSICTKWTFAIIELLANYGKLNFNSIQKLLRKTDNITSRALSETLKKLLITGLIDRKIMGDKPPLAVYGLTLFGQQFRNRLYPVIQWFDYSKTYKSQ